jgi:hypothetical protein
MVISESFSGALIVACREEGTKTNLPSLPQAGAEQKVMNSPYPALRNVFVRVGNKLAVVNLGNLA